MTTPDQKAGLSSRRRPELDGTGLRVAIACSRFNDRITDRLLAGCRRALEAHGVTKVTEEWVPGAYELPLAAKYLAATHDAVVTLGAVIRGETAHFDLVAGECAAGVARVSLDTGVPAVFGVLATDTVAQAEERSGDGPDNVGYDVALTAIEMAQLVRRLSSPS
jgi:6,7-dimethyl-8-ribityllumazine synthase